MWADCQTQPCFLRYRPKRCFSSRLAVVQIYNQLDRTHYKAQNTKLVSGRLRHLQNPIKLHLIHLHNPFCTTSRHDVPVPLDCFPQITCNLYTILLKTLRGAFYSCMSPSVIRNECGFQSRNQFETWWVCWRSFEHWSQPYSFKGIALCSSRVILSSCP